MTIALSERLGHFEVRKTLWLEFLIAVCGFFGSKRWVLMGRKGSESFDRSDLFGLRLGRSVF